MDRSPRPTDRGALPLYIQDFDDGVVLVAVNEVESRTTGLSRKIWQKLMILQSMGPEAP
jgi:hypothetical protein